LNSYQAFIDANRHFPEEVSAVRRTNSANSVWIASDSAGTVGVLKYHDLNGHQATHSSNEINLYASNLGSPFIPSLIASDSAQGLIALDFEFSEYAIDIPIDALLAEIGMITSSLNSDWLTDFHPPGILAWWGSESETSVGSKHIIKQLAEQHEWCFGAVEAAQEGWEEDGLIHGDMKISNLLLRSNAVKLIDWESVTLGPPEWDAAGLIQSVLCEIIVQGSFADWARRQLPDVVEIVSRTSSLQRAFLVSRLLQSSIEYSNGSHMVSRTSANILQVAEYIGTNQLHKLDLLCLD
jgi:hypothetical protein